MSGVGPLANLFASDLFEDIPSVTAEENDRMRLGTVQYYATLAKAGRCVFDEVLESNRRADKRHQIVGESYSAHGPVFKDDATFSRWDSEEFVDYDPEINGESGCLSVTPLVTL